MREYKNMFVRRLIMAWQFKVWPWTLPYNAVKYIALDQRFTEADIRRTHELAKRHGWETTDGPHL